MYILANKQIENEAEEVEWTFVEWDQDELILQLVFQDGGQISQYYPSDVLGVVFGDQSLFIGIDGSNLGKDIVLFGELPP